MTVLQTSFQGLFPSLLHKVQTNVDKRIEPFCLQIQQENPTGVFFSNQGGWQSLAINKNSLITDILYNIFENSISKLYKQKLKIIYYWININGHNNSNIMHNHPRCDLSGVYYVKVPENSGHIYFRNPHDFVANAELFSYNDQARQDLKQEINTFIQPKDGLLLLFPAYLQHGVMVNQSNEKRISIAFNIKLI